MGFLGARVLGTTGSMSEYGCKHFAGKSQELFLTVMLQTFFFKKNI